MSELNKITQFDHDNIADITWFIKGLNYGNKYESPFCSDHEESLKKILIAIKEKLSNDNKKQS